MDESSNEATTSKFSFSEVARQALSTAEHWNERQLEALCFGIPPEKYGDHDDCAPDAERKSVRGRIEAAIQSETLYAVSNPNAGIAAPLYPLTTNGGRWHIEPARAVRWVISQTPKFPKFPDWLASSKFTAIQAMQEQEQEAKFNGRYTLGGAAKLIAENAGEREEIVSKKLEGAAERYEIPMYEPGKNAKIEYGKEPGKFSRVRAYHEECYWDDLNRWLERNESRIGYRFAAPESEALSKEILNVVAVAKTGPGDTAPSPAPKIPPGAQPRKPVQRQPVQEEVILAKLTEKGFAPLALPLPPRRGAQSPAKQAMRDGLGYSRDVLDKAWQRLRATGKIKDADR